MRKLILHMAISPAVERTNGSKLQRIRALETKVLPSGIVIEKYARGR